MALTERQQEIVELQKQGKKASEIAEKLGISTNAVYQHLRRLPGRKGAKPAAKSGRKSGGKPGAKPAPKPTPAPAPVATVDPGEVDPTKLLRTRQTWLTSEVKNGEREIERIKKDAAREIEAIEKAAEKHTAELAGIEGALGVMSGTLVAHQKPKPKPAAKPAAKASGSGGKAGTGGKPATAPQTAPTPPAAPAAPAAPQGTNGSGTGNPAPATPPVAPATA